MGGLELARSICCTNVAVDRSLLGKAWQDDSVVGVSPSIVDCFGDFRAWSSPME